MTPIDEAAVRCYACVVPFRSTVAVLAVPMLVAACAFSTGCEGGGPPLHGAHARHGDPTVVAVAEPDPAPPPGLAPAPDLAPVAPPSAPVAPPSAPAPAGEPSREGWNEAQIHWETWDAGIARAQRESRPVLLVLSASWCGHCRTYSHVFEDARIVERARRFVMVHLDQDVDRAIAERYVVDGRYVPRTYLLGPDGSAMPVTASNPRFRYFYDEHDPASLLAGMDAALARMGG